MSEVEWMNRFADNLRDIMLEQGYTQKNLAEALCMSESTISYYLNAKRMPTAKIIINMAYEFGLDLEDLIDFGRRVY